MPSVHRGPSDARLWELGGDAPECKLSYKSSVIFLKNVSGFVYGESSHTPAHTHTPRKNDIRPSAKLSRDFPWVLIFLEIVFNVLLIFLAFLHLPQ